MIAMGVVVSVLILGRSGLRSTFLVTSSDHIAFDIPWSWNMHDIRILHTDTHHSMCIIFKYCDWAIFYILFWAFIPFWSWGVGKRGKTGKMPTNKWKVWARFKLMMIMIMIMIIQDHHTGPDILLKKTIQDVLNATLRFWFNLSNTSHKFCINIERKKKRYKREGFSFAKSIYKCESFYLLSDGTLAGIKIDPLNIMEALREFNPNILDEDGKIFISGLCLLLLSKFLLFYVIMGLLIVLHS